MKRVKRSLARIFYTIAVPVVAVVGIVLITLSWLFAVDDLLLKLIRKNGTESGNNVS